MNYLETLISLDGPALESFVRRTTPPGTPVLGESDLRRVALVGAELGAAAVLIAVTASIANGRAGAGAAAAGRGGMAAFLPALPAGLEPLRQRLTETGHAPGLTLALTEFQTRFDFARRFSIVLIEAGADAAALHLDDLMLADVWRHAAGATLAACRELAALTGSVQFPRSVKLDKLLEQASRGDTPCLDREGRPFIPGWAERRRSSRIGVDLAVEVDCGAAWWPARLVDVSTGGLGLRDLAFARVGDHVTVLLPDGRPLEGCVMWAGAEGCGIELGTPLAEDDPLLDAAG